MTKIQLYIATTIDGFIARKNGSLDWLDAISDPDGEDFGYQKFYEGIGIILMGRKTYEEVLGFGVEWPYTDCKSYVVTSHADLLLPTENTELLHELDQSRIEKLQNETDQNIWVVGGGELITNMLNLSVIDEMILTIIPIILGEGIPLFAGTPKETMFDLVNAESFKTGVVNLTYKRKPK